MTIDSYCYYTFGRHILQAEKLTLDTIFNFCSSLRCILSIFLSQKLDTTFGNNIAIFIVSHKFFGPPGIGTLFIYCYS